MIGWNKNTGLFAGLALIMISNATALALIYYNRTGEPDARLTLSQRELSLPYYFSRFDRENSGVAFKLNWRILNNNVGYASQWGNPAWLNENKLRELGFDTSLATETRNAYRLYSKMLPREAYVVLEFDGPVYKARLKQLLDKFQLQQKLADEHPDDKKLANQVRRARINLDNERNKFSRLFAVDAGVDKTALRNKYPDRDMYIIATGEIRIVLIHKGKNSPAYLTGRIQRLNIDSITSPYAIRKKLETYMGGNAYRKRQELKYNIVVAYGKRLEPWIEKLTIVQ